MTEVRLYGELGLVFGEVWHFTVASLSEALRALEANTGKFYRYLYTNNNTLAYRIRIDGEDVKDLNEAQLKGVFQVIEVIPIIRGSGNSGSWLIIIGVILVAIAVAVASAGAAVPAEATLLAHLAGGASALAGGTAGLFAGTLASLGIALTLGGIAQLVLSPSNTESNEKPENKPSYIYGGPVNTYRQGNPVPVVYGEIKVGSQVISAGVTTLDISPTE